MKIDGTITLSRPQTAVNRARTPLTLDMAGQRAGKSQMIGILTGQYIVNFPIMKGFIGANTYQQLSQSTLVKVFEIWRDLYHMRPYDHKLSPEGHYVVDKRPPDHFIRTHTFKDYNNIISFWNGHIIFLGSLENYLAHEGKEFGYAHLDETKDTREDAVKVVILARLSQRGLYVDPDGKLVYDPDETDAVSFLVKSGTLVPFTPCWIHTSPAIGQVDWIVKLFDLDKMEVDISRRITGKLPDGRPDFFHYTDKVKTVIIYSTYHNQENLPYNYIETRLNTLSQNEAQKFIFGYPFAKTGGEFFPAFSRTKHTGQVGFLPDVTAHVTFDFNVLPYMTMLCAQVLYSLKYRDTSTNIIYDEKRANTVDYQVMQIRVYKEYCLATPDNTVERCCQRFDADHRAILRNGLFFYGDSSGKARIVGLGSLTNFKQVENYLFRYLHNSSDRVRKANISVLQRRDMMNRLFEGKVLGVEIIIDQSCENTLRDLEYLKLGNDGKLKEMATDPVTNARYQKIGHCADALEYMVCEMLRPYLPVID